jgi:hypothetical protein
VAAPGAGQAGWLCWWLGEAVHRLCLPPCDALDSDEVMLRAPLGRR